MAPTDTARPDPTPDIAILLRQAPRVRALARRLVRDRDLAEDLAQDVWLQAAGRLPRDRRNLRSWLSKVVTNSARQLGRGRERRVRREQQAAEASLTSPAAADVVAQAETHRMVVDAVMALGEPYRSTVLLTFFQGWSAADIARRDRIPAATVRSRLHRALGQLRKSLASLELARPHPNPGGWRASLAPLAAGPIALPVGAPCVAAQAFLSTGWILMHLKHVVAAALIGVAAITSYGLLARPEARSTAPPAGAETSIAMADELAERGDSTVGNGSGDPGNARERVAGGSFRAGTVRAPNGTPIGGASIRITTGSGRKRLLDETTSSGDGTFEVVTPPSRDTRLQCTASAEGFLTAAIDLDGAAMADPEPLRIRLEWACEVRGVVADASTGRPLAGGLVTLGRATVLTDTGGRYQVVDSLRGASLRVRVEVAGYVPASVPVVGSGPRRLVHDFSLVPGNTLPVVVTDRATGLPIEGVNVRRRRGGEVIVQTDAAGRFSLPVTGQATSVQLDSPGFASLDWSWRDLDPSAAESLQLSMRPLAWWTGVVRSASGAPIAGAWVFATTGEAPHGRFQEDGHGLGARRHSIPSGHEQGTLPYSHPISPVFDDHVQVSWKASGQDATQSVCLPPPHAPVLGTTTGVDGRFGLPLIGDPRRYVFLAGGASWIMTRATGDPDALHVELRLHPAARVHGVVRRNGEPWFGGRVLWNAPDGGLGLPRGGLVTIAPDGTYGIDSVPTGSVQIEVHKEYAGVVGTPQQILLAPGEVRQVDFDWEIALAPITGQVRRPDGEVLAGIPISAHVSEGYSTTVVADSDAQGRFSLSLPEGETFDLMARNGAVSSRREKVLAGTSGVDFVLPENGELLLLPVDAATGEALLASGVNAKFGQVTWRVGGTGAHLPTEFDYSRSSLRAGGVLAITAPEGLVDISLDFGGDGYVATLLTGLLVGPGASEEPLLVPIVQGVPVTLRFADPQGLEQLRERGVQCFFLESRELGLVKGPFPTQGGGSNHNYAGDLHLWCARPSINHRRAMARDDGVWLARGLAPGNYRLVAFPDAIAFQPEWIAVGAEPMTVDVAWWER